MDNAVIRFLLSGKYVDYSYFRRDGGSSRKKNQQVIQTQEVIQTRQNTQESPSAQLVSRHKNPL